MSELRKEPFTQRWVIFPTDRRKRPSDFVREPVDIPASDPECPFCEGHEALTPHELHAHRPNASMPNGPGWQFRIVPNAMPLLRVEGGLDRHGDGVFDRMHGIGAHEVVIETPHHGQGLADLSEDAIDRILHAIRDRMIDLARDQRFRYISVFENHGINAGARTLHAHAQIIALPVVPKDVWDEVDGARAHYQAKERCLFCDILHQEAHAAQRVVGENADVVAISPYASRCPFETWILPRRHEARFERSSGQEFLSLARQIKEVLGLMNKALERPAYNLVVHTAPIGEALDASYHWHVEILPRLTRATGFDWATGVHVNPVTPEEATQVLRGARG